MSGVCSTVSECAAPSASRHLLRSASTNATPVAESLTSSIGGRFAVALLTLHDRACLYLYELPRIDELLDDVQRVGAIGVFTEVGRQQTGSRLEDRARSTEPTEYVVIVAVAKGFLWSHAGRASGVQRLLRWETRFALSDGLAVGSEANLARGMQDRAALAGRHM